MGKTLRAGDRVVFSEDGEDTECEVVANDSVQGDDRYTLRKLGTREEFKVAVGVSKSKGRIIYVV